MKVNDMRMMLALVVAFYSAAVFAQAASTPAAEDKPPVAERPAKEAKAKTASAKGSVAVRLQSCQDIEDGTKGRLDCYDEVLKPAPKAKAAAAKTVMECKFVKEEDERLACYNGFVDMMPKLPKG
jgi:hypothetical protein